MKVPETTQFLFFMSEFDNEAADFWVLFIVHALGVFVLQMTMIHIIPSAIENGISPITSAFILPMVGILSIVGKIGGGMLGDTLGNRKLLLIAFNDVWLCFISQIGSK